jgi:poly-gamma-glutamate synthesis protein (capsule biosynthesis protein)
MLAPARSETVLSVTGDLMCHEWQLDNAQHKASPEVGYNFDYAFEPVSERLGQSDFVIGNLETVLGGSELGYSGYPLFNTPDEYATALKNAGFDFVTTANNHCNDKSWRGMLRTLETLERTGLDHAGTVALAQQREEIYIKEVNGIKFALVPFTYGINGTYLPKDKEYMVSRLNEEEVRRDISAAKLLNPDFIIALPHMGDEYALQPREYYKNWARLMLEAGADIVLASHPHVLQPMEWITITEGERERKCFVAYSLGNFISSQRTVPRDAGVIMNLHFKSTRNGTELKEVTVTPTWVKFINSKGQYDIQTLIVSDVLAAHERGEDTGLRSSDLQRLKDVWRDAERIFMLELE